MPKAQNPVKPAQTVPKLVLLIAGAFVFLILIVAAVLLLPSAESGVYKPHGIAIIPLKGEITNEGGGAFSQTFTANEIISMIDEADNNPSVGAIFLDIDSPGGEVVASKHIAYKVREAQKPVYSYINSVGASGGYYVAAASDYVMADPDSITGSIGVISTVFDAQGLLEKLGMKAIVLTEGDLKDTGSPFSELTPEKREVIESILAQAFAHFKSDVLSFREGKITKVQLEKIADGRILTGEQAYKVNLVDELTTREKAIGRAAELAGIANPEKIEYGRKQAGLYDMLFASGEAFSRGILGQLSSKNGVQILAK